MIPSRTPTRVHAGEAAPGRAPTDEDTRAHILRVATEEFAAHGLAGARVDAIADRTRTTKGMIYYYFRSKEQLYVSVIEHIYALIRLAEDNDRITDLPPVEALAAMVERSFDFHRANPHVSRLISIENINDARYLKRSDQVRATNSSVISSLDAILGRGRAAGIFRDDVTAHEIHFLISALCVFRMTNRATFNALFAYDSGDPGICSRQRRLVVEAVLRLVSREGGAPTPPEPRGGSRKTKIATGMKPR